MITNKRTASSLILHDFDAVIDTFQIRNVKHFAVAVSYQFLMKR